jgi:hypothetical protein
MPWWLALYVTGFAAWFLYKAHFAWLRGWYAIGASLVAFAITLCALAWI